MSKRLREGENPMNMNRSRWKMILTSAFLLLAIVACGVRTASALSNRQGNRDSGVRAQVWSAVFGVSYRVAGTK